MFKTTSIDDWKTYLRWHLINATAPKLSSDFVNERLQLLRDTSAGTQTNQATLETRGHFDRRRDRRSARETLCGRLFPAGIKGAHARAGQQLKDALADRIKTLEWMDEPTKQEALKKLAAFTVKIGYPDKWRDYSLLKIDRGPYALNTCGRTLSNSTAS